MFEITPPPPGLFDWVRSFLPIVLIFCVVSFVVFVLQDFICFNWDESWVVILRCQGHQKEFFPFFQQYQRSKHIVVVIGIYIDFYPISLKRWNIIEEKTKCLIKVPKISKRFSKYHWSSDHRCSESFIEVQTIEAQKVS